MESQSLEIISRKKHACHGRDTPVYQAVEVEITMTALREERVYGMRPVVGAVDRGNVHNQGGRAAKDMALPFWKPIRALNGSVMTEVPVPNETMLLPYLTGGDTNKQ
ncbi:hypothetical protein TRAPUB_7314 [Trametes pubescens]|uniref:Uncharacterized protein n=1 Tax=Trametes pubescens TaxID=154538 RepID=A0A1M2V3L2_TRAPU|nr:hypothetical protein TRAPUB_7314 [Trametes pubescens]